MLRSFWDHCGNTLGACWVHVGISLGHLGIALGSSWGHLGITLGSLRDRYDGPQIDIPFHENPGPKNEKTIIIHCFPMILWPEKHPQTFQQSSWSFWTNLDLPRPLPTHFASHFHPKIKSKKKRNKKTCKSLKKQKTIVLLIEGLGPLPNCRSRFCGSNRLMFSSGNLLGTSLVTKQCSN